MSKHPIAALVVSFSALFASACGTSSSTSSSSTASASPDSSTAKADSGPKKAAPAADVGKQCERFSEVSAAGMKKIEAIDTPDAAKDAETMAKLFDALGADIGKIGISDPELKKLSDQYVAMVKEAATTQRSLAKLVGKAETVTSAKAEKAFDKELGELEKKVDKYVKTEDQLVNKIDMYCLDK